jgi:hypothetical protein
MRKNYVAFVFGLMIQLWMVRTKYRYSTVIVQ